MRAKRDELICDLRMECQSISDKLIPLKISNMYQNTLAGTKRKDCVLKFLLPKPSSDSGYCQKPESHFFVPQNQMLKTTLLKEAKLQDSKKELKVEDLRKRRLVATSYLNCNPKQSKVVAVDVNMLDEEPEDANLLPSKRDNQKSEITLIPVKAKACGCPGPCEIITCEVIVQQYIDQNEVSLMLAMNIEEEEIDACVMKHCDDEYCDALNIDHDRCRRGLIELYRCDKSDVCDVCRVTMKGWKSRLYHKECERKNEYRHNNVSQERLLKDRFRLRELQILQDSKVRRNNYLDPINGPALALEALRKNKELMITPRIMPSQKPILTITAVPNTTSTSVSQPVAVTSQTSNPKNAVSNAVIAIRPRSNAALSSNGTSSHPKENTAQQTDPVRHSSAQQNTYIMTSSGTARAEVVPSQSRYIRLPNSFATTVQPTTISNLIVPQLPYIVTNSSAQPKALLAPIRVMPITNLKTAPSLLHRQQGIPKFCVMAGNVITTLAVPNVQALQPIIAANIVTQQEQVSKVPVNISKAPAPAQKRRILPQKRILPKRSSKQFFCVYCCKYFSTDWYFKKHVARHEKEKHTPRISIRSSGDRQGTKSHASEKHDVQEELDHDYACDSPYSLIRSPADRTDGELETHEPCVQLEYDTEDCDEDFANETNNCATISDFNQVEGKKIKYEKMFNTWNGNVEIFRNGIKIEAQDDLYLEDISFEDDDIKESLNENCSAEENKFTIVSVVGNTNSENFEGGDVAALR